MDYLQIFALLFWFLLPLPTGPPPFPLPPGGAFSRRGKAQQSVLDKVELKEVKDRGRNENG